jgi:hypothetical protein
MIVLLHRGPQAEYARARPKGEARDPSDPEVPVMLQRRTTAMLLFLAAVSLAGCENTPHEPAIIRDNPIPRADKDPLTGGSEGITMPTTGKSDDGGTFRGTITISGAAFNQLLGPVLVVRIRGTLIRASTDDESSPSESVNLNYEPVDLDYDDGVRGDEDCIELELNPGSVSDSEMKQTITLDPSRIRTHTLPGPAHLIADLICANDRANSERWSGEEPPQ